jgi:hypothetical protein
LSRLGSRDFGCRRAKQFALRAVRAAPLAALIVKVTDGFFLIGLSNVESERSRNLLNLKERCWFDVPLVYVNQHRAIIAIEKGARESGRSTRRSGGVGRTA